MVDNGVLWTRVLCVDTRQMTMVLLLLGAFECMGLSRVSYQEKVYGDRYHVLLRRKVGLIEFIPKDSSNVTTLWKEGDSDILVATKRIMVTTYFSRINLTQKDSGRYVMRDKNGREVASHTLEVKAITKTYERKPGDSLTFSFDLEPDSCNIFFQPDTLHQPKKIVSQGRLLPVLDESDCVGFYPLKPCGLSNQALQMSCKGSYEIRDQDDNTALVVSLTMERITWTFERKPGEHLDFIFQLEPKSCNIYFFPEDGYYSGDTSIDIVRQGKLQWDLHEYECTGFNLLQPCGISIEDLQMACNGRYEIADKHGNTALVVSLEMQQIPYELSRIGIGVGVFLASLFCICVRRCCRGKSSSKPGGAAPKPDVHYQEYDNEPVGPRPNQLRQPSGTSYPAPPSYTPTRPLIHGHPTVNMPPAYSEVSVPTEPTEPAEPAEPADAPTFPVDSDPGPQFELTGMNIPSAPPLSSDSSYCAVYTSDKLNFL